MVTISNGTFLLCMLVLSLATLPLNDAPGPRASSPHDWPAGELGGEALLLSWELHWPALSWCGAWPASEVSVPFWSGGQWDVPCRRVAWWHWYPDTLHLHFLTGTSQVREPCLWLQTHKSTSLILCTLVILSSRPQSCAAYGSSWLIATLCTCWGYSGHPSSSIHASGILNQYPEWSHQRIHIHEFVDGRPVAAVSMAAVTRLVSSDCRLLLYGVPGLYPVDRGRYWPLVQHICVEFH